MAIYTVHEPPRLTGNAVRDADRFRFVRDGFYGWAFLLPPLWMLWHRLWLVLLGYLILLVGLLNALAFAGASGGARALVTVLLSILVGTEGGTLRRFGLMRRRYRAVGVVVGDDVESAERRFFATWDLAQGAPRPSSQAGPRPSPPQAAASGGIIGLFPEPGAQGSAR